MNAETLKTAIELAKMLEDTTATTATTDADMRKVIVRSRDAGVIYGKLAGRDGDTVFVKDGIQLWKWFAAKGHTLIDVATHGVKADSCKFSPSSADVTVLNACAIIDVTESAAKSIEAAQ